MCSVMSCVFCFCFYSSVVETLLLGNTVSRVALGVCVLDTYVHGVVGRSPRSWASLLHSIALRCFLQRCRRCVIFTESGPTHEKSSTLLTPCAPQRKGFNARSFPIGQLFFGRVFIGGNSLDATYGK